MISPSPGFLSKSQPEEKYKPHRVGYANIKVAWSMFCKKQYYFIIENNEK